MSDISINRLLLYCACYMIINVCLQGGALSQSYNTPQPFHPSQPVALSQGLGPHPPTSSYSLSQPTQPPPDGIYSTPIDSLPQHVTQHITRFVPRNRVLVPRPNRTMTNNSSELPMHACMSKFGFLLI